MSRVKLGGGTLEEKLTSLAKKKVSEREVAGVLAELAKEFGQPLEVVDNLFNILQESSRP